MIDFEFHLPTRVIFGKGAEKRVGEQVKAIGSKVLLHYGGGSIKRTGLYDKVISCLNIAGVPFVELGGVKPNPHLSLVREGVELCKKEGVDCVLAVGGGSVIDSAKAIAMGVAMDTDIWPCFINRADITAVLPVGCVLTIPSAGSECSCFTVITNEDGWYKRGTGSPLLFPRFAIINPELSFTLPAYQVGCGCTDILAHLMERYFTMTDHVDVSDRMLEGIMRSVLYNAPISCHNLTDYNSRAELCWAGTLAHNNLLDRGRHGDWVSHALEQEMSGIYDIAHGAGLAIIFPAWFKYVYRHNIQRFVQFAVRVMDVVLPYANEEAIILEGISRLEKFFTSLGMPTRFSQTGVPVDRFREMAEKAVQFGTRGNILSISAIDGENIYQLAV